jgi:peroxiredoxin
LQVLGVNVEDEPEAARTFRDRHSLSYPMLVDREARAYRQFRRGHFVDAIVPEDVVATPFTVVLDREGRVRYRQMGFSRDDVRRTIEELLDAGPA